MEKVYIESLGCPKNLVDSEYISRHLSRRYILEKAAGRADIIIINTCGFIEPAKQESIDTILEYSTLTRKRLIVTGCLVNLYRDELKKNLPALKEIYTSHEFFEKFLNAKIGPSLDYSKSMPLTPKSYAYVKVSDGCSRKCSYCTIPLIKGAQYSRPVKNILKELKHKTKAGFREIILIAQDLINFGREHKEDLFQLLEQAEKLRGDFKIRLLYLYPDIRLLELVRMMSRSDRLIPYLDIPLQHISSRVLRAMHRPFEKRFYLHLLDKIRSLNPEVILRSTFIIGFPGETRKDFNELVRFLKEARFHWAGFYPYSDEERSQAFDLKDKVRERTKKERLELISSVQKEVTSEWLRSRIGRSYPVLIDEKDEEGKVLLARSQCEAPEIDGHIILKDSPCRRAGDRLNVRITQSLDFDLLGEVHE